MGSREGFRVVVLNQVIRDLTAIGLDVDDLKGAFASLASQGAQEMSRHVPVKSGRLASSVRGNRAKSKAVVTAGRASVPYAGPINYGWPRRGISPADFTGKTDQVMQPRAIAELEREINAAIRRRGLA